MFALNRKTVFVLQAFTVLWLLILFTGCSEAVDVRPGKISGVTIREIRDRTLLMDVDMTIVNRSSRKIVVRKLVSDICLNDEKTGTVTIEEKVVIPSSSEQEYRLPVKIEHENFGRLGRILLGAVFHRGKIDLEMKGVLYVRSGIWMKKIRFDRKEEVPLRR